MNRRDFLRAGAAAGLGTLAAGTASGAEPGRRLRAGFLGVAYSHGPDKIRLVRASPDYELTGVWAENDELARRWTAEGVPVRSGDEVLRDSEVIFVESEIATHAVLARRALEAGRHVHLEKPPALTLAEFRGLVDLARRKERLLQVGYMWRHNPGLNAALEAARRGWLGRVYLVRGTLNNTLAPQRRAEWAAFPGGVLFELGSHLVDAIVRLLGRPDRVTSFLRTDGSAADKLADNNLAVFEFANALALLTSATLQPNASAHRAFEILGTAGTAIVRPLEPPALQLDLAEAAGPYRKGPQTVTVPAYRRYEGELAELAACIREGRPLPVSLDQELTVQETLLRAVGVQQ